MSGKHRIRARSQHTQHRARLHHLLIQPQVHARLVKDNRHAIAVAAGNHGMESGIFREGLAHPACTRGALSVGGVYDADHGSRPWSIGCTDATTAADQIACFSQSASYLGVLAPGAFITAAELRYAGTTQATPHVAGAVAALAAKCTTAGTDELCTTMTCAPATARLLGLVEWHLRNDGDCHDRGYRGQRRPDGPGYRATR